jgi:predicted nucleotidyltransferase
MTKQEAVHIPEDEIRAFCEKNHIRKLALFGSILRDDFRTDSDIDVLVEFEPGHVPGFDFFAMQDELSAILGRRVDLVTPGFLSPYIREKVESEARVEYVKT